METDLTTAFQDYVKSLGRTDLYKYNFTLSRNNVKDLTEDEFGKMMDEYQIPPEQRCGSRANWATVKHQESGSIQTTILIFSRSKNHKYHVVVAKGEMSTCVDWKRTGLNLLTSVAIGGAASIATGSPLGLLAGVISFFEIGSNINNGPKNHKFKDVVHFMMEQLLEDEDLIRTKQGKLAFVHDGEDTLQDDNPGTDHSSCCIGCFPFKKKNKIDYQC